MQGSFQDHLGEHWPGACRAPQAPPDSVYVHCWCPRHAYKALFLEVSLKPPWKPSSEKIEASAWICLQLAYQDSISTSKAPSWSPPSSLKSHHSCCSSFWFLCWEKMDCMELWTLQMTPGLQPTHGPSRCQLAAPCISALTYLIWLMAWAGKTDDGLKAWKWSFGSTLRKQRHKWGCYYFNLNVW